LLLVVLISLFANFGSFLGTNPTYSLTKTSTYNIKMETTNYHCEYYVDQDTLNSMR